LQAAELAKGVPAGIAAPAAGEADGVDAGLVVEAAGTVGIEPVLVEESDGRVAVGTFCELLPRPRVTVPVPKRSRRTTTTTEKAMSPKPGRRRGGGVGLALGWPCGTVGVFALTENNQLSFDVNRT